VGGFDETIFISQCNTAVDKDDLSNAREFARGFLGSGAVGVAVSFKDVMGVASFRQRSSSPMPGSH